MDPLSPDGTGTTMSGVATTTGGHFIISPTEKPKSDLHGMCLTMSDHDRLRIFMHEFCVRALIPWAERQMRILNDQVSWLLYLPFQIRTLYLLQSETLPQQKFKEGKDVSEKERKIEGCMDGWKEVKKMNGKTCIVKGGEKKKEMLCAHCFPCRVKPSPSSKKKKEGKRGPGIPSNKEKWNLWVFKRDGCIKERNKKERVYQRKKEIRKECIKERKK